MLGFPSFFPAPHSFLWCVCGGGGATEPLHSEKKFSILRLRVAPRDGPSHQSQVTASLGLKVR